MLPEQALLRMLQDNRVILKMLSQAAQMLDGQIMIRKSSLRNARMICFALRSSSHFLANGAIPQSAAWIWHISPHPRRNFEGETDIMERAMPRLLRPIICFCLIYSRKYTNIFKTQANFSILFSKTQARRGGVDFIFYADAVHNRSRKGVIAM